MGKNIIYIGNIKEQCCLCLSIYIYKNWVYWPVKAGNSLVQVAARAKPNGNLKFTCPKYMITQKVTMSLRKIGCGEYLMSKLNQNNAFATFSLLHV